MRAPIFWRARGVRGRAISEPLRRRTVDSTASLRSVSKTFQGCGRIDRPRPQRFANRCRARASSLARGRVECASVRFVRRCGCGWLM
eukprot:5031101-Lingulodinium_polyedra.AAC.1